MLQVNALVGTIKTKPVLAVAKDSDGLATYFTMALEGGRLVTVNAFDEQALQACTTIRGEGQLVMCYAYGDPVGDPEVFCVDVMEALRPDFGNLEAVLDRAVVLH